MVTVQKHGYNGILLPEYDVGLDIGDTAASHIFISHAHADHVPRDRKLPVFATPATAALMKARGFGGNITEIDFMKPIELPGDVKVTLYPAGHILGSAMVYVQTPTGNVLYTGDFRNPPSPSTEGFECPADVDILITEATFSLPVYRWDSHEKLFEIIREFATEAVRNGNVPVFLCYNLGKAQEVMMALAPTAIPVQIHGAGYPLCQIYEQFGMNLGNYSKYNRETVSQGALITPMSTLDSPMLVNIRNKRIAYCSGWASLEARRAQITVDKLIPISDHADFFEIVSLCERLRPAHVYITHTPNPDVLQYYLEQRGISSCGLGMEYIEED